MEEGPGMRTALDAALEMGMAQAMGVLVTDRAGMGQAMDPGWGRAPMDPEMTLTEMGQATEMDRETAPGTETGMAMATAKIS